MYRNHVNRPENPCSADPSVPCDWLRPCVRPGFLTFAAALVVEMGDPTVSPSLADSLVATALILWLQHPDGPALQILDQTMQAYEGEDLDFEFDEELSPPHPFAELVRQAFAPHLNPTEIFATIAEAESTNLHLRTRIESTSSEWHLAIERFAERYGIWEPCVQ